MLVLTRDLKDSTLLIGDDIEIKVVSVKGNQVRLAINAPDEVNIVRTELLPPEQQPSNLPEVNASGNTPKPPARKRSQEKSSGNRSAKQNRSPKGYPGYREPRQLTPNTSYSRSSELNETDKKEKIPVISLKRRRQFKKPDESSTED